MSKYEGKMYCDNASEWETADSTQRDSPIIFRKKGRGNFKKENTIGGKKKDRMLFQHVSPDYWYEKNTFSPKNREEWKENMRISTDDTRKRRIVSKRHGCRDTSNEKKSSKRQKILNKNSLPRRKNSRDMDSEEEYRRSRSREKERRRIQLETIRKYCKKEGESQVFWDGFQWVSKGDGNSFNYDQQMNATRRARRLHIGSLPQNLEIKEDEFRIFLWREMKDRGLCNENNSCPILHIWFARDRGGSYGFVEMNTVEGAHALLSLDGICWKGSCIRINRPSEWKKCVDEPAFGIIASTSGIAFAESLAAAAQQAINTGNANGLAALIAKLPPEHQTIVADYIQQQQENAQKPVELPIEFIQCQIAAELLRGKESRVLRIVKPTKSKEILKNPEKFLEEILNEFRKCGGILSSLAVNSKHEEQVPTAEAGDVFLEYVTSKQVDKAIMEFSGRIFHGQPMQIERFNDLAWNQSFKYYSRDHLPEILAGHIGKKIMS